MNLRRWWILSALLWCLASVARAQPAPVPMDEGRPALGDAMYRLDVGDVVRVIVYGEPDLSGVHVVGQGGVLLFPLLGEVPVDGLTTVEVSRVLSTRLAERYLQNPQVTVRMEQYGSKPVQVLGAVEKPGVYYLNGPTTLLEMLALAGDVDQEDGPVKEVQVRREGRTTTLHMEELLRGAGDNPVLAAGDVVYVPEGLVVYVSGQVEEPGEVAYTDGLTVTRALAKAGGPKPTANKREAYILRDGEKMAIPLRKILQGRAPDVELEPGDQLFLQESVF